MEKLFHFVDDDDENSDASDGAQASRKSDVQLQGEWHSLEAKSQMTWNLFTAILQQCGISPTKMSFTGLGNPVGAGAHFEVWRYQIQTHVEILQVFSKQKIN